MRSPARWIVVALALGAAAAFAMSVTAGRWWTIGMAEVGPFGTYRCFGGECSSSNMRWLDASDTWQRAAVATGGAGLIAGLVMLVIAGAVAAGRVPRIAAMSALAALATCMAASAVFVLRLPSFAETSIDRGLVLFVVALALGLVVAVSVLRTRRV